MKHFLSAILIILTATVFGQSQLKFEKDTVDLGTVILYTDSTGREEQKFITLDFPFINSGNEPLILIASPASGYGTAELPASPLLPKQKGMIKATFTRFKYTGYLKKEEGQRPFITSILIQGNFPEGQKYICIKGFVKKEKKKK